MCVGVGMGGWEGENKYGVGKDKNMGDKDAFRLYFDLH